MEIGLRFVNRMSHLATPDAFESRNRSHSTGDSKCQGSKTSGTWNSTLIKAVRAPFDDQVTMATMYLSEDTKLWWRTRDEDVLEGRCEINAWEELNRKLKERSSSSAWERCTARTRVPDADRHCSKKSKQTMGD